MFLFKTKTRTLFTTFITGFSSYAAYDKYEFHKLKKDMMEKASKIAQEPMGIHEMPRKVIVYTAPDSQYTEHCFQQYVKPIFDAAALDYDLIVTSAVKKKNQDVSLEDKKSRLLENDDDLVFENIVDDPVRRSVRNYLWKGKKEAKQRPSLPPQVLKSIEEANLSSSRSSNYQELDLTNLKKKLDNKRTWSEFIFGKSRTTQKDLMAERMEEVLHGPKYSHDVALIAVSPEAFDGMLKGLYDGCFGQKKMELIKNVETTLSTTEEKIVTDDSSDSKFKVGEEKEKKEDLEKIILDYHHENLPLPTPKGFSSLEYNTFDLPVIGYVPSKNLQGFKKLPHRIYLWLHERNTLQVMGNRALDIVFEHTSSLDRYIDSSTLSSPSTFNSENPDQFLVLEGMTLKEVEKIHEDIVKDNEFLKNEFPSDLKKTIKIYVTKKETGNNEYLKK